MGTNVRSRIVTLILSPFLPPSYKDQSFRAIVFSTQKFISYLLTAQNTEIPPKSVSRFL